ncbi:MAG TPA: ABC transporter permease [Blastocatellia bacterium]|nr:ABC transporter permease [Blastocatellia bacterium]
MNFTRGIHKLAWIELKLFLREPIAAFFTLAFPLMMLFLFGSIYGNKPSSFFGGYGAVDVSVPAYTAMIIGSSGLLSLAIGISSYRETGVLKRLKATPIRPAKILAAQVTVIYLMTVLGMVLLIAAGRSVYGLRFGGSLANMFAAFTLSAASIFAIGFVLASLSPSARVAQVAGMVIFYPMIFLSGATIPRETLPEGVRRFSQVLPLTHVVTLLRGLWAGGAWDNYIWEVIVLIAVAVVAATVSSRTFRWE